ncbi:MAG: tRNA preQ1(34) S-adenosylmethionine ribosyltransferase-isomerase QueA [Terracidiphilus sp.]
MTDETETARGLRVADFDFELPAELIAQQPPAERGSSRMLIVDRATGTLRDAQFADLPSLLDPGDLLVLNDSRVIPARLFARRTNEGAPSLRLQLSARVGAHKSIQLSTQEKVSGLIEVLLTEPAGDNRWRALVKPGKRVGVGEKLMFFAPSGAPELHAEVIARGDFGERLIEFAPVDDFFAVLDRIGHVPLPPYIRRKDANVDRERYQTVFSHERGSVAAPTAGLHFTRQTLETLTARRIEIARVTLHVGLGTFAPLRVDRLDQVHLHGERYTISSAAAAAVNRAAQERRRIVAVGTTVVRTLESAAQKAAGRAIEPHSGTTDIFISPGFEFRAVSALLTNFHLPQSSLLMLVSALAGRERVLAAYRHAVEQRYSFFSYGDCMFIA